VFCTKYYAVEMGGAWGRREVHTDFWWGNLRQGDHLEDLCVDGG